MRAASAAQRSGHRAACHAIAFEQATSHRELLGERWRSGRGFVPRRDDALRPLGQREYFRVLRLQRHRGERPLDPRRELAHLPGGRLLPGRERHRVHAERLAEVEQRGAPEGAFRPVVEPCGHDLNRRPGESRRRPEGNARRARLERPELRLRVRRSLGKQGDRPARGEHGARRLEGGAIRDRVRTHVLAAMHGNGLECPTHHGDHRHAEERRLGEKRHAPRGETQEERRVDEPAGVVEYEDHGSVARDVGEARHFDPAEENAEDQTEQRPAEGSHGVASPTGRRLPRQAA
jgi:hypothetical protein